VTRSPRAVNNRPREAQIIPFPRDDVTPPVTKIYLVDIKIVLGGWMLKIGDILTHIKPNCEEQRI
jgi:hypothetical protein